VNSRERLMAAIGGCEADRLPVAPGHHIQKYFLDKYCHGIADQDFLASFGFDSILWVDGCKPDLGRGQYVDPAFVRVESRDMNRIFAADWEIKTQAIPHSTDKTVRWNFVTPGKTLSMVLRTNDHTTYMVEKPIKEKKDVEVLAKYMPDLECDVEYVNSRAAEFQDKGIVMGHVACFPGFGQPGCWQDAACLYGIQELIMETFDDPEWVHAFLGILLDKKKKYIESLDGARYDLLLLGGGDASSTVISPDIFRSFVAPYDAQLIETAHKMGQRISYHTCGGMMPILEDLAAMKVDCMETFTPVGMGGDVLLREAKRRIGDKVCMIGGFDQFHYFVKCSPEETRKEVRRCFEEAGEGGGYILAPSDHFFDAESELIRAFTDEAMNCHYGR
jgi:uroporphyrinogen decarboxylase